MSSHSTIFRMDWWSRHLSLMRLRLTAMFEVFSHSRLYRMIGRTDSMIMLGSLTIVHVVIMPTILTIALGRTAIFFKKRKAPVVVQVLCTYKVTNHMSVTLITRPRRACVSSPSAHRNVYKAGPYRFHAFHVIKYKISAPSHARRLCAIVHSPQGQAQCRPCSTHATTHRFTRQAYPKEAELGLTSPCRILP